MKAARRPASGPACPICDHPASGEHRPFCSARCADIDLGRWLSDRYAIPVEDEEPDPDALGVAGQQNEG
jgi:hypothetical protein